MVQPWPEQRTRSRMDIVLLVVAFGVPYLLVRALHWRPLATVVGPGFWAMIVAATSLVLRYRATGRGLRSLGLGRPAAWGRTAIAFVFALLATILVGNLLQPWLAAHFGAGSAEASSRFQELQGRAVLTLATLVVVAWAGAAVGEEVVFRGGLMRGVEALLGGGRSARTGAVLIQAAAFAAIHLYQGTTGAVLAGTIGLIFGLAVYGSKGSLWPAILIHAIPDTMTVLRAYHRS